nr:asparagine synthase B [Clostridiales bacterium]
VCNGEIYGFEKVRGQLKEKGYVFSSDSDCEVLLPMWREYGADMFAKLDAEFALIIYDGKSGGFIAARDPIGIRPLYYGFDKNGTIIFASEAKNLVGLCGRIMPFPPGCYWKDGEFRRYCDIAAVDEVIDDDVETVCRNIREKLTEGVKKRLVADAKVGFLLSGGLDSSLVCAIAAKESAEPIRTFAIGMEKDAIDLKYARQVADYIGSEHTEVFMSPEEVVSSLETVIELLGTYDITTIRASMGMYLVCRAIHETTDIRVLLTGEISDELFGYKYTDFAPSAAAFQAEAQKRIRELHMYDVLRADRCISVNSLEARVPFGDLDFVKYVMSVDPAKKMNVYGKGKYLLRHAFEGEGLLPDGILWREKAAFSDAVGHSMVDDLKEYAETVYTDEQFKDGCEKYVFARPFTKESLLYRDIFEKYYPGQAPMVAAFWMPNKEWEGCDVSDPSARVLSNYGDSGK